jgi:hypothetical protein
MNRICLIILIFAIQVILVVAKLPQRECTRDEICAYGFYADLDLKTVNNYKVGK